jgi:hypothetical protein
MKKALGFATNILFFTMITVLIGLMSSYTITFVGKLFPSDWIKQWGSLVIFDAGAVIWFLVFMFKAKGAGQRGTSLLGLVIDFIGGVILAGAEIFTAAETYLSNPTTAAWLRETATYVLMIWLAINIALTYIFHITDPKTQQDMRARNIQDQITDKALDMAEAKVNMISAQLADELSDGMKLDVLAQLNITNPNLLPASKRVIDAQARDTDTKTETELVPSGKIRRANRLTTPGFMHRRSYAYETKSPVAVQATEDNVGPARANEPDSSISDNQLGSNQWIDRNVNFKRCAHAGCIVSYDVHHGFPANWRVINGLEYCPECAAKVSANPTQRRQGPRA